VPSYLAPGVYVEETSFRAPSIEGVGTSTAAFAGPALTGPIGGTPPVLTSFGDFANIYGGFDNLSIESNPADPKNINYLALSVQGFFDNGGSVLYVSRVFVPAGAADTGVAKAGTVSDTDVSIVAAFPGAAGNRQVTMQLVLTKTQNVASLPPGSLLAQVPATPGPVAFFTNGTGTTFMNGSTPLASPVPSGVYVLTLRVLSTSAASSASAPASVSWDGLGFDPAHPLYVGSVLGPNPPRTIDALQNQFQITVGKDLKPTALEANLFGAWTDPTAVPAKVFQLSGGDDGVEPASTDYDAALACFEALEDVAIVAAPGSSVFSSAQAVINSLITHVSRERAYRIAVLDTPPNQVAADNENVRAQIDCSYAALYVPWISVPNPLARAGTSIAAQVLVPPSGYMAGIYARSDEQNGVAKAPANEVVLDALGFERNITFGEQQVLNPLGINCLRFFPDRGYRVWGARTATSDTEFMYVNVRRYLIYLEHSIDNSTQWAVFENNGPALWARVHDAVDSFLYSEYQQGNLLGSSPSEAYFVRVDRTTMTQNDLDNGRMICLIGVALLKPAEFVIFRIGQFTANARS
jgi:Bacteriophage tail sheath protein